MHPLLKVTEIYGKGWENYEFFVDVLYIPENVIQLSIDEQSFF